MNVLDYRSARELREAHPAIVAVAALHRFGCAVFGADDAKSDEGYALSDIEHYHALMADEVRRDVQMEQRRRRGAAVRERKRVVVKAQSSRRRDPTT